MSKFGDFIKSIGRNVDEYAYGIERKKKSGFEWRAAGGLNAINQMEELYIYKSWGAIFHTLGVQFARFAVLTLISFDLIFWFCVPVWAMILYEYFLVLKWFEKFNISILKILFFTVFVEVIFLFVSPFIRTFIWFLISGVWPA